MLDVWSVAVTLACISMYDQCLFSWSWECLSLMQLQGWTIWNVGLNALEFIWLIFDTLFLSYTGVFFLLVSHWPGFLHLWMCGPHKTVLAVVTDKAQQQETFHLTINLTSSPGQTSWQRSLHEGVRWLSVVDFSKKLNTPSFQRLWYLAGSVSTPWLTCLIIFVYFCILYFAVIL
jgi:hypothetical protein